ncbi:uncharacterized protein LOC110442303 [Mizuhopecten yessoensis]|uniref:TIR domain-containing protein n=1 Tax=Mizuhopecten yessoensis TaxID=6573 RepID=A0A210PHI7_MIZYE|nr:uncharacterized protein LOC110442303 [Mizuhopecten yessoensis]OWF35959.1 hypothetical protein KP79_PYT23569 [Mizuhopecten yessoensis]
MASSSNLDEYMAKKKNMKRTLSNITQLENKVFTQPPRYENDTEFFKSVILKTQERLLSIIKDPNFGPDKNRVFCSVARKFLGDLNNLIYYTATTRKDKFETGKIIGDELVENSTITFFCKTILKSEKDLPALSEAAKVCVDILNDIANYSAAVCRTCMDYKGMLRFIREALEMWRKPLHSGQLSPEHANHMYTFVGLVHNSCMCCTTVTATVRSSGIIKVLKEILLYPDLSNEYGMMVVAAIADIMDEGDSDSVLRKDDDYKWVRLFIDHLKEAVKCPVLQHNGWFSFECGRVLRQLSCFDANKMILVDLHTLPALVELARINEEICLFEAVTALSQLAFEPGAQKAMIEDGEGQTILLLFALAKDCTFQEIREIARGTIWTMAIPLRGSPTYGPQVTSLFSKKTRGHIMISYSREQRQVLQDIRAELEANKFTVWMDVDRMRGDVYERMAEAVENAAVVILAMSRSYKMSEYCRREAAYAGKLNKQVIPLKVEKDYDPDGWLGIMTAGSFFYDFGRKSFKSVMAKLLHELQHLAYRQGEGVDSRRKSPEAAIPTSAVPEPPPIQLSSSMTYSSQNNRIASQTSRVTYMSRKKFRDIDKQTFQEWLDNYQLPRDRFESLRPKDILFLARMKDEAPESYYSIGRRLFKDKSDPLLKTRIMADLTEALDDLV